MSFFLFQIVWSLCYPLLFRLRSTRSSPAESSSSVMIWTAPLSAQTSRRTLSFSSLWAGPPWSTVSSGLWMPNVPWCWWIRTWYYPFCKRALSKVKVFMWVTIILFFSWLHRALLQPQRWSSLRHPEHLELKDRIKRWHKKSSWCPWWPTWHPSPLARPWASSSLEEWWEYWILTVRVWFSYLPSDALHDRKWRKLARVHLYTGVADGRLASDRSLHEFLWSVVPVWKTHLDHQSQRKSFEETVCGLCCRQAENDHQFHQLKLQSSGSAVSALTVL